MNNKINIRSFIRTLDEDYPRTTYFLIGLGFAYVTVSLLLHLTGVLK